MPDTWREKNKKQKKYKHTYLLIIIKFIIFEMGTAIEVRVKIKAQYKVQISRKTYPR